MPVSEIHFHEVGSLDAVADVTAVCLLLEAIGAERIIVSPLCTGFGLSRYGESLLLVDANYNLLDSVEVPALEPDVSYARAADGSWGYAVRPTPGEANGEDIIPAWN